MSALADRDNNIGPTSNPQDKQAAGGEENKPQESQQQQPKSMLDHKDLGGNEYVRMEHHWT